VHVDDLLLSAQQESDDDDGGKCKWETLDYACL
jgi:hypothetical protein